MTTIPFNPDTDLPPHGATVVTVNFLVRFDATAGWWLVAAGPPDRVGAIARQFSEPGRAMTREWAIQEGLVQS